MAAVAETGCRKHVANTAPRMSAGRRLSACELGAEEHGSHSRSRQALSAHLIARVAAAITAGKALTLSLPIALALPVPALVAVVVALGPALRALWVPPGWGRLGRRGDPARRGPMAGVAGIPVPLVIVCVFALADKVIVIVKQLAA